jgi:hypothetical protein
MIKTPITTKERDGKIDISTVVDTIVVHPLLLL